MTKTNKPNKYEDEIKHLSNKASEAQEKASNPTHSAWVEASAGTGKTKVLSDRVLRLLLEDVSPSKILCLTYTNAAAVEMKTRIGDRLSKWAVMSEKELIEELDTLYYGHDILNKRPDLPSVARKLFAKVLDAPDTMRVETIHAFCTEILKRFPIEAGISPYFEVADDQMTNEMLEHISEKLLKVIEESTDPNIKDATLYLTSHISELDWTKFLRTLVGKRQSFLGVFEKFSDVAAFKKELRRIFDLDEEPSKEKSVQEFWEETDKDKIREYALILSAGQKPTDQNGGKVLMEMLEHFDLDAYEKVVSSAKLVCVDVAQKYPDLKDKICFEKLRVLNLREKLKNIDVYESTSAVAAVALKLIKDYAARKQECSCMDFDDLVMTTYRLLKKEDVSAWVLYKLDNGIDHILIDEAQDTSPLPWQIMDCLLSEFFSGNGRTQKKRTLFVVGDRKQSIYGFQGADPKCFEDMYTKYRGLVPDKDFDVELQISFRSTKAVLDVVNKLFSLDEAKGGVCDEKRKVEHLAYRLGEGGLVEFWPLTEPDESPENVWREPIKLENEISSETKLAYKIARKIKKMVVSGEILESKGRPVRYSDFIVLLRDREPFMGEFVRAAKKLGVNVTGVDRLKLKDELAVQDLCALSAFLLLPNDDLSLACVLRSPLYNLSEDDLFELCFKRGEKTLWQRLKENPKYDKQTQELLTLLSSAQRMRPFELFDMVLNTFEGKKRFYERLGMEAKDALDELMNLTLKFESSHVPNLQNFMSWLEKNDVEIKRELEQATTDAVRLMTVHKSKGLQAPIVILPDTTRYVKNKRERDIIFDEGVFYFPLKAENYNNNCMKAHDCRIRKQADEEHRLLYVAATRAEDRLYVAGTKKSTKSDEKNWYELLQNALEQMPVQNENGKLKYNVAQEIEPEDEDEEQKQKVDVPENISWLATPQNEENLLKAYHPSHIEDLADDGVSSPLAADKQNFRRGVLIHKLLQMLPRFSSFEKKSQMIKAYLAKQTDLEKDLKDNVEREVLSVLSNKDFSFIFEGDSRAEVPVMGMLNGKLISGQIDRLVILKNKVLIVDFKTNRPAAGSPADVSTDYKNQLDIYAGLIEQIYPNLAVEKYILWTNTLKLMKI